MISKQRSKESLESPTIIVPNKKRKIILAILAIVVSLSIAIEVGIGTTFSLSYASTADSYKDSLCISKVLDMSQKGIIRDAGGFNGAIYECAHTNFANSIYGDAWSTHQD